MTVPMILPARRVIISPRNAPISPLIVIAIRFLPIQLNLSTEVAAGVVVVVAIAAGVIGEALVVKDDVHTIVTALQAKRTHLHSDSEIE